jgi:aminopeptidase N
VTTGLPAEADVNLITGTLRQAQSALTFYAAPAWARSGWQALAATARQQLARAEPGSGLQIAWARASAAAARTDEDLTVLDGWLNGRDVPTGLAVIADLRWAMLQALVAMGWAGVDRIEAELDADRTASGERLAAQAHALVPSAESKAETWRRLVEDRHLPNWLQRSLLLGFQHPAQVELTSPYVDPYFDMIDDIWATLDSEPAQDFVQLAYPSYQVTHEIVDKTDGWLGRTEAPAPLRRLVAEGRDGVIRALQARAKDASR